MTGDTDVRLALPARTRDTRLIVVVRAPSADDYDGVIEALLDAGVQSVELTLTTPGTIERLAGLVDRYGDGIDLGVGTVVDADQLSRAVDAGARYLVTPVTSAALVAQATAAGVPIVPGGLTPTELYSSWSAGATAVKIFPAGTVGVSFGSHLRGPFPDIKFVPSGGISLDDVPLWLRAGATAVSLGGPLIGDAFSGGSLGLLADRAKRLMELVAEARSIR